MGKFLAAVTLMLIILAFSLLYYVILCFFKAPNFVSTLVCMFGFLLVSMAAITAGMFISSITENQIVAASITLLLLFLPDLTGMLSIINLMDNYQKFPAGIISVNEIVPLIAYMVMFILFTIIIMQRRKSIK